MLSFGLLGLGSGALVLLGAFFGFFLLLMGLGLGFGVASQMGDTTVDSSHTERLVDGEATADKKIVVLSLTGVIMESMGTGPSSVSDLTAALRALRKDESVVGVLLYVDSPGGGVTASDRIYRELRNFKEETELPVHALFGDVAASGGYYAAMACDRITAHPTTITGSIGVISQFYQLDEAMEKLGLSINVIKSGGEDGRPSFKDMGSPYRPMRPDERALLQELISEMWDRFTQIVAEGREGRLKPEEVRLLADGRVFSGQKAHELGLVDHIGYREDAYSALREAAGAPDAKVVDYRKRDGLFQALGLPSSDLPSDYSLGGPLAQAFLRQQPRFCYLWTGNSI